MRHQSDPRWIPMSPGRCMCQPCGLEISNRGRGAHKRSCVGWQPPSDGGQDRDPDGERMLREWQARRA